MGKPQAITLTVENLAALHAELSAKGVKFTSEPQTQPWGTFATVEDSEGNQLIWWSSEPAVLAARDGIGPSDQRNAWAKSAMISSAASMPTDTRIRPSPIPMAARCSGVSPRWDAWAG